MVMTQYSLHKEVEGVMDTFINKDSRKHTGTHLAAVAIPYIFKLSI